MRLRQRKSVVVLAGESEDSNAHAVVSSLRDAGIEILNLGHEASARRIATFAADAGADSVEVCVSRGGGLVLLRDLLRELKGLDEQGISIVVHRDPS